MRTHEPLGPLELGERLLSLLDEGSFTATYKYAVLLALIELCLEKPEAGAPLTLSTYELSAKVIDLYWPQTLPFVGPNAALRLRQNTRGQAEILSLILRFRERLDRAIALTPTAARRCHPREFDRLVRSVEWKLIEMPLPRLQVMGNHDERFLYDIAWTARDTHDPKMAKCVRQAQDGDAGAFDRTIRLRPGVRDSLVRLSSLLRPLVHRQWASMVASINGLEDTRLEQFLFGSVRLPLDCVRQPLRELQNNRCFYCGDALNGPVEVDHFIPWARYPDNGLSNLVVADRRCNHQKRDFLADQEHVGHWLERVRRFHGQLAQLASDNAWDFSPARSHAVAQTIYTGLPQGYLLWRQRDEFVSVDPGAIRGAFLGTANDLTAAQDP